MPVIVRGYKLNYMYKQRIGSRWRVVASFQNGLSNRLVESTRKPGRWHVEVGSEPKHPNAVPHANVIIQGDPWPEEK